VAAPADLPPEGARLRETPLAPRRRLRRSRVPRLLHRAWLGADPMPERFAAFGASFARHHPGWDLRLWTDEDLPELGIGDRERRHARSASELSDLLRYEVLHRHGGVYADTDVECLRPFDPLLQRAPEGFVALEAPGRIGTAILAAPPGHPVFARAAREARSTLGTGPDESVATGPVFLTHIVEQEGGVTVLGAHTFYPYMWNRDAPAPAHLAETFAIHHWARTWWGPGLAR
jgi:mannosyltransferase OCH1-like enzyme